MGRRSRVSERTPTPCLNILIHELPLKPHFRVVDVLGEFFWTGCGEGRASPNIDQLYFFGNLHCFPFVERYPLRDFNNYSRPNCAIWCFVFDEPLCHCCIIFVDANKLAVRGV